MFLEYGADGQIVPEPRTLSGTLYYAGGNQPAEHVNVELYASEGSIIAPQTTSSTGWFEFRGLPHGSYVIAIRECHLSDSTARRPGEPARPREACLHTRTLDAPEGPRIYGVGGEETVPGQKCEGRAF